MVVAFLFACVTETNVCIRSTFFLQWQSKTPFRNAFITLWTELANSHTTFGLHFYTLFGQQVFKSMPSVLWYIIKNSFICREEYHTQRQTQTQTHKHTHNKHIWPFEQWSRKYKEEVRKDLFTIIFFPSNQYSLQVKGEMTGEELASVKNKGLWVFERGESNMKRGMKDWHSESGACYDIRCRQPIRRGVAGE